MSAPPVDMIKGALAAYNLETEGTHDEVYRRLGDHLVKLKFKSSVRSNNRYRQNC